MPSVLRLFCDSKFMTAPCVMTLLVPGVHRVSSESGWFGQRQVNDPTWSLPSWVGDVSGDAGVKVRGR
jgi:hypothetical protein